MLKHWFNKDSIRVALILLVGAGLAYLDALWNLHTIPLETVHAIVVSTIFVFCLVCQRRYPEIQQFGWNKIVWGLMFLTIGSWVDIIDDPASIAFINQMGIPYDRGWEIAFLKKVMGYTVGIGLFAYGFFQWIPWMIATRLNMQKLNQKLSQVNKNMNTVLMSLDEHVESERLRISRELHDDVAQQLTFLGVQLQLCKKEIADAPEKALERVATIGKDLSETLRSVRQVARDLRPESLYALGLVPALEQFLEKLRPQCPDVTLSLVYEPLPEAAGHSRIESHYDDRALLHLFRLLQEGIRNALKHSQATLIEITIAETPDSYRFLIEDDGVGLPWETIPADDLLVQDGHLGIAGMRERVAELSGTFMLQNRMPRGAQMEIVLEK